MTKKTLRNIGLPKPSISELEVKLETAPGSLTPDELERLDEHYDRIAAELAELYANRSVFHELVGRLDEALELMKKASKSCPDNIEYVARIKRIEEKISKKGVSPYRESD